MITINKRKILSYFVFVIIAILFWISTVLNRKSTYSKDIWIELVAPDSLILLDNNLYRANVTLEGKGMDLIFENRHDVSNPLKIFISPFYKKITKEHIISNLSNEINGLNIDIINVAFTDIDLKLDFRSKKTVPVIFKGKISFMNLFGLKSDILIEPKTITIKGPKSKLESIKSWNTEIKDFKNLNNSIDEEISLIEPYDNNISISTNNVRIVIPIEEYTEKKLNLPVKSLGYEIGDIEIFPDSVEVSFLVGLSKYDIINSYDFMANIYLNADSTIVASHPVSIIKKPKNVLIQYIQPNFVDVYLKQ